MSKYKYILFDLDGTLTDPYEGITRSVQYALDHFGIKDVPQPELKKFIGPPLKASFMEYYGFDDAKAELAVEKYRERFRDTGIFENEIYDGVEHMLGTLKDRGLVLAIASSKPTEFVERILKHFHIYDYFANITGSFMDGRRTDKYEVIMAAMEALAVADTAQVLMVGDRHHDVDGAVRAGVDCVGAAFGYGGRAELEQAGATAVVDCVAALEQFILEHAAVVGAAGK